jgi:hypothetical protein
VIETLSQSVPTFGFVHIGCKCAQIAAAKQVQFLLTRMPKAARSDMW